MSQNQFVAWELIVLVLLSLLLIVFALVCADALAVAGPDRDRRPPNRWLTLVLALVVLALLGLVSSIGADVLP